MNKTEQKYRTLQAIMARQDARSKARREQRRPRPTYQTPKAA